MLSWPRHYVDLGVSGIKQVYSACGYRILYLELCISGVDVAHYAMSCFDGAFFFFFTNICMHTKAVNSKWKNIKKILKYFFVRGILMVFERNTELLSKD